MHRPRRKRATRCLEYNNGMLHEEEVALRRALHASLAAIKSQGDEEESNRIEDKRNNCSSSSGIKANQRAASFSKLDETSQRKRFKRSNYENDERCRKKLNKRTVLAQSSNGHSKKLSLLPSSSNGVKLNEKKLRKKKKPAENVVNNSNKRSIESLPKVRVQRKFAQANVLSPRSLHMFQSQMQPTTTRAKTEDFLDFLCLRGSSTLPTSLSMFNNPCAPLSPLSDEEDDSKSSSSKIINDDENIDEPKSSLLEQHSVSNTSCKTNSHMSSPTSSRAQPRAILPEFTNNHGVFSNIPSPISYPSSSSTTPCKQPGFNEYGIPTSCPATPPLIPMQPRLSTCVTKSSVVLGESKSFHSVAASSNENVDSFCTEDEGNIESCRPLEKKKRQTCLFKDSSEIDETKIAKDVIKKKDMVDINKENFEALNTEKENQNVPVFTPTESEFKNPMKFFESIKSNVEKFGICLISPPKSWQPEYSLSDEIRFTTKLQRIHCLKKRCPSVEVEMCAIKNHLEDQNILFTTMPQIAGCELDLPFMSKVVEEFGGLQQIIDKRKWHKVADSLRIPKSATDRTTKLEHIYCKYLLSYDMLSREEKTRLRETASQELNNQKTASQYLTKGRSMSLALFQRNAKNIKEHLLQKDEDVSEIEKIFDRISREGERYIVVHSAEFEGTAFPTSKMKPFYKSRWNLNILPKSPGSLLRDISSIEGITCPMVKVEMALSTETWNCSPHHLYTIEYCHHGDGKIWYSIPKRARDRFLQFIKDESNDDTNEMNNCMISYDAVVKAGIPVYRVTQDVGQFVVKFPEAYHSSLSMGFSVSEFLSFAPLSSLSTVKSTFMNSHNDINNENHLFCWEFLIITSLKEELHRKSSEETLNYLIPEIAELRNVESDLRNQLKEFGCHENKSDKESTQEKRYRARKMDSGEIEKCYECNAYCFPSTVLDVRSNSFCLRHAIEKLKDDNSIKLTLTSHISLVELNQLLKEAEETLHEIRTTPRKIRKRRINEAGNQGNVVGSS